MHTVSRRNLTRKKYSIKSGLCKNKPMSTFAYSIKCPTRKSRITPSKIASHRNVRVMSSPSVSHGLNIERIRTELSNQRKALSRMDSEAARVVAIKRLKAAGLIRK